MSHHGVGKETEFNQQLLDLDIIESPPEQSLLTSSKMNLDLLRSIVQKYANNDLSHALRNKAGDALLFLLRHYKKKYEEIFDEDETLPPPGNLWERLKRVEWRRILTKSAFSFLVGCGIINATAEAFDGVSSILFALHLPHPFILASCIVLGLFSICLYFAFELTQLSDAIGVKFIERYSEANRLHEIQQLLKKLRCYHQSLMRQALQQHNLSAFNNELQELNRLTRELAPAKEMVRALKEEQPSTARWTFKYAVAALAGFLSGAIAFFNGEALLHVLSTLTGIAIGAQFMWVPIVLGIACFLVVTSVALANEGRSMMRLIDKLLGKPSKIIDSKLDISAWEIDEQDQLYYQTTTKYLQIVERQTILRQDSLREDEFLMKNQTDSPTKYAMMQ